MGKRLQDSLRKYNQQQSEQQSPAYSNYRDDMDNIKKKARKNNINDIVNKNQQKSTLNRIVSDTRQNNYDRFSNAMKTNPIKKEDLPTLERAYNPMNILRRISPFTDNVARGIDMYKNRTSGDMSRFDPTDDFKERIQRESSSSKLIEGLKERTARNVSNRPTHFESGEPIVDTSDPISDRPVTPTTGTTGGSSYQGGTTQNSTTQGSTTQGSTTGSTRFQSIKDNQYLRDAIEKVIQFKQGYNRNLEKQRTKLEGLSSLTAPAGSAGSVEAYEAAGMSGFEFGEEFRSMSPQDQNSMIQARDNAINAHINSLDRESKYRGTRMEDTLQAVKDYQTAQTLDRKATMEQEKHNLSIQKSLNDLGDYTMDNNGQVIRGFSNATAKQIADAMKIVESGGNYSSKGASGEYGAYQFMPATWNGWVNEYSKENNITTPIDQSPENQDMIAEWKVQQWLDSGYNAAEIASLWNSGHPDWEGRISTNSAGVHYNVPAHVDKVLSVLGRIVPKASSTKSEYTQAMLRSIAKANNVSVADLKKMSDDQIAEVELAGNIAANTPNPVMDMVNEDEHNDFFVNNNIPKEIAVKVIEDYRDKVASIPEMEEKFAAEGYNPSLVRNILSEFNRFKDETLNKSK